MAMTCDILIRGGTLIDGSGRPGEIGDIAVCDGRIAALGPSLPEGAARVIDAEGLAVAPGFIDIKTHSDFTLPIKASPPRSSDIAGFLSHRSCRARRNCSPII
jgi:N-acyl-D-aspartate/D-glutamate deacylase